MLVKKLDLQKCKKVAIYARVSTTEQAEEGYSIDEQVRILKKWCEDKNYKVYDEYVDRGISGKSIYGRPALQRLLNDANNKAFDIVVVWKMNRLARKLLDTLKIVKILSDNNINFLSYTENYETETSSGRLQFHVMGAIAEFERDSIAENVKMGMLARAKEGYWNGGQVLGYDTVKVPKGNGKIHTKLEINEREAQTVKRIFQLYIEGHGYKSIANIVNKEGHKSKKNNYFSTNAIRTIITNPIYVGLIRYNVRRDWSEKRRNNINPDPILVKGQHQSIISQDVWDKAQTIFKNRSKKPNRIHSGEYPLTGIMKCPVCGSGMVLSRTTNRKKDGTKRVLEYYACSAWKYKGIAVCRSNAVRVDYANNYVFSKIAELVENDVLIQSIVKRVNKGYNEFYEPIKREIKFLWKSLEDIKRKKDKNLELYEDGIFEKHELKERISKLNEEKERLSSRLALLEQQLSQVNTYKLEGSIVKEVMSNFVKCYKSFITAEQRKHILQILIKQITIAPTKEIDSIQIQFNNQVISYFTKEGEGKSSDDDFSSPFSIYFDI